MNLLATARPDRLSCPIGRALGALLLIVAAAAPAGAQTDYYNLDAGRPVVIEDAHAVERHAFELQLAPFRLERERGGIYQWVLEPELAYGVAPRTSVEVAFPILSLERGGTIGNTTGLAGIELSALHSLNTETEGWPALAVAGEVLLPVGGLAPEDTYAGVKGILTRTYSFARVHLNAGYTFGPEPDVPPSGIPEGEVAVEVEASRWLAGAAVDRVFPLQSLLVVGELFARQPIEEDEDVQWNAGAGVRWQYSPRLALDAGLGRTLTGDERWYVTVGAAYAFAIRGLVPIPGR